MGGFLSSLVIAWAIYALWKWMFPGREVREQKRNAKRERKLGLLYPSGLPRDDSWTLKEGIDFKMGRMFKWKDVGDGMLLIYKPAVKNTYASVLYNITEREVQASYELPVELYVQGVGRLKIKAPKDAIAEACIKSGEVQPGDAVLLLHTSLDYIKEWRGEKDRIEKESKEERERRHQKELAEAESRRRAMAETEEARAKEREKEEIARAIKDKQRRRELEKQVRQELIDSGELFGEQMKRPRIPAEVRDAVYRKDGGRCQECGATEDLQFDHIIPFSKGGATSVENLQLLCGKCNREKSNKIG